VPHVATKVKPQWEHLQQTSLPVSLPKADGRGGEAWQVLGTEAQLAWWNGPQLSGDKNEYQRYQGQEVMRVPPESGADKSHGSCIAIHDSLTSAKGLAQKQGLGRGQKAAEQHILPQAVPENFRGQCGDMRPSRIHS
jgi:hypothetical protein